MMNPKTMTVKIEFFLLLKKTIDMRSIFPEVAAGSKDPSANFTN
jgi:hypothetical protein